jgi:hypothetical protein
LLSGTLIPARSMLLLRSISTGRLLPIDGLEKVGTSDA